MSLYLVFIFALLVILSFLAQEYVNYVFQKWGKVSNDARLTGMQVAERISTSAGLGVELGVVDKKLGDHYDPQSHTVRLSAPVAGEASVSAMAIAAHELGHAQQQLDQPGMIRLRDVLVPAVRLAPTASYMLLFLGAVLGRLSLVWMGLGVLVLTTVFMLLTLPIEFDASRRALVLLDRNAMLSEADRRGARQMLTAAALTYVVASVFSVVQLLRFIWLRR